MNRTTSSRSRLRARRGFSMVEVLLAVFLLGVGVISIASLFPAGIAQQQRSNDDVMGPIVANNALAILRTKMSPDDFGTFEEHGGASPVPSLQSGDWPWLKPSVIVDPADPDNFGANDVFGAGFVNSMLLNDAALPQHSLSKHGGTIPSIIIGQGERWYPQAGSAGGDRVKYLWDFAVRRFQGQTLVAIFVYRVNIPSGERFETFSPAGVAQAFPFRVDLTASSMPGTLSMPWPAPNSAAGDVGSVVIGTTAMQDYHRADDGDPTEPQLSWQTSGQWIVDQHNNVHHVLVGRRDSSDEAIELVRPVPAVAGGAYETPPVGYVPGTVTRILYIPTRVDVDVNGDGDPDFEANLTPVYATVKAL